MSPDRRIAGILRTAPPTRTLNGHFDGKHIVLDDRAKLKPNIRVKIIVLKTGLTKAQIIAAARASQDPFSQELQDNNQPGE